MKKKVLLLDVDEVICFPFLRLVNNYLGTNYSADDFTNYYMDEEAIPPSQMEDFKQFKRSQNIYEKAYILPDAIDTIKRLNDLVDIRIYSSCLDPFDIEGSGRLFVDKFNFLIKTFPFLDPKKFIFTSDKSGIKGDIQIDDRLDNLQGEVELKILFPSYHNKLLKDDDLNQRGVIRAGFDWKTGWKETEKIICSYLEESVKN